jgi:3-methyladenine DNA glycosylase AlkD
MNTEDIVAHLKKQGNNKHVSNMKRYAIDTTNALGVPLSFLRPYAKKIGTNHLLALNLWQTDIHEARLLATMIDDPKKVDEQQMEQWVDDFQCWDLCDQCCLNLFDKTTFTLQKIQEWTQRRREFVKRAGFVLIAALAIHDKKAKDEFFDQFYPLIQRECTDERIYVKKAISWALRSIGKRNQALNQRAIEIAKGLLKKKNKTSKWIATKTINELTSQKIQNRISKKIIKRKKS